MKLKNGENGVVVKFQPPSGGCVLKRKRLKTITGIGEPSRLQAAVC